MDDIVMRLRTSPWLKGSPTGDMLLDAAAEIERLRSELDEYRQRVHWLNEELLRRQ